jgi:hypothetical protein
LNAEQINFYRLKLNDDVETVSILRELLNIRACLKDLLIEQLEIALNEFEHGMKNAP